MLGVHSAARPTDGDQFGESAADFAVDGIAHSQLDTATEHVFDCGANLHPAAGSDGKVDAIREAADCDGLQCGFEHVEFAFDRGPSVDDQYNIAEPVLTQWVSFCLIR